MEKVIVEVENVSTGSVSYRLPTNSLVKRKWSKPGTVKRIEIEEIREVISSIGGESLFKKHLLIKDDEVRKELELIEQDEVMLDDKTMGSLIRGPLNKLSESLPKMKSKQKQRMAQKAIEMNIDNISKADVLREHTGIDVYKAIQEKKEDTKGKENKVK